MRALLLNAVAGVRHAELMSPAPLRADQLYRKAAISGIAFETTADLTPLNGLSHQNRARDAIAFGTGIETSGYNIFVIGSPSARLRQSVRELLEDAARRRPQPSDWVYVNNFAAPQHPKALSLPAGRAKEFEKAVHDLIEDLKVSLPAMFDSDEYQKRRGSIEQTIRSKTEQAFTELQKRADEKGIAVVNTPMGLTLRPVRNGEVVSPDEFHKWPPEQQKAMRDEISAMEKELEEALHRVPRMEKELRDAIRALDRETARFAITRPVEEVKAKFNDIAAVAEHIDAIGADLLENVQLLISPAEENAAPAQRLIGGPFDRYEVNVLVARDQTNGAPVIEERHPTLSNLVGRTEYLSVQGALVTNFRFIRPGALHRANGGTLTLDVRDVLSEPFTWAALKRALLQREIAIEDVARFVGLTTTVSLEPDPIPLDVKVVLFGDRFLYYLLQALDSDVDRHFKVIADFDDEMPRSASDEESFARLVASLAREKSFKPLDRDAVARIIEHASRIAEDASKLSLLTDRLRDIIAEAGYWAGREQRALIGRQDVERAIAQQKVRASRLHDRTRELILRDVALIETSGSKVGQINGLSVYALGDYSFGVPSRITCRVSPGSGKVVDVEREVELGGPNHSKGVLILAGFLSGRYAIDAPMSLHASLVFEQSYGAVEGDSASSAELYALLSMLADAPLRQDFAATGSVDQHGIVQAVGGVNEKIEGFFDICSARGLTGSQGVLIPKANVQHLMLRSDVVDACTSGRFAVYPIESIDEGISLLTGLDANALHQRVEERLRRFAKARQTLGMAASVNGEVN